MSDQPTLPPRKPNATIDHTPVQPTEPKVSGDNVGTLPPTDGTQLQPVAERTVVAPMTAVPGYELFGELGRGGMGVVYRARQIALNRPVALKMVLAGGHAAPDDLARFLAEAEAVAALQHSGVVQVFDFGTRDGLPYFALELCPGGSLAAKLAGKPLPAREAAELVEKIARAVQHAHDKGIVHRDLKPGNILLAADDTPKVTDFGLAKRVEGGPGLTQTGAILGTPSYMAPEQAGGPGHAIGPLADVYALGAILYECLTGRPPFLAATALDTVLQVVSEEPVPLRQQNPQAPADLETVAHKCLQKEPARRYASAAALADDLGRWLREEPITARPVGATERLVRWGRRNKALAAALAAAVLFLVGGAVASTAFGLKATTEATRSAGLATVAMEATAKAEAGERRATEAAAKLADEKESLDRALSRANFLFARARWQEGRSAEAAALLDAVRADDRGFEWGYVRRQNAGGYATLYGHAGEVRSAAFSPDGTRLLTAGAGEARVWDTRTGANLFVLKGSLSATYSPDGQRILTAGDTTATVWDARTGAELFTLRGHTGMVVCAAFDPGGSQIVTVTLTGTTKVWDAQTRVELQRLSGDTLEIKSAAFSPDGGRIVTTSFGGTASIRDAQSGAEILTLRGHNSETLSAAFAPDGQRIVTTSMEGTAKVWDAGTGAELVALRGHRGTVTSAAFSPDGRRVATAGADGARVWDARTGTELFALHGHTGEVIAVAFSPDGGRVVTASKDATVKLWDLRGGSEFPVIRRVLSAAFSPDGERIFSFDRSPEQKDEPVGVALPQPHLGMPATVWDARSGTKLLSLRAVNSASFCPTSARIVATYVDGKAKVWDSRTGAELLTLGKPNDWMLSAAFSADGTRVVTANGERVRVWDAHTGAEEFDLVARGGDMGSAAFSPDGRRVVAGNSPRKALVWDPRTGAKLYAIDDVFRVGPEVPSFDAQVLDLHTGKNLLSLRTVSSVVCSPGGEYVVATRWDRTATIWDVAAGTERVAIRGVESATFNANGSRVLTTAGAGASIWDARSGAELVALRGHTGTVRSAAYSRDGRRIVTASDDQMVKLWDAMTGAELLSLRHSAGAYAASFSPDGRQIIATGVDGTATVWDGQATTELLTLRGHTGGVRWAVFSPDGRRIGSRDWKGVAKTWDVATGREIPGPPDFPVDADGGRRHGHRLILLQGDAVVVVDLRPDDWDLGQRAHRARIDPTWHQKQAAAAAQANDAAAEAFHRGWVATAWPDDADAWTQLDAACRQAGSPKHMLAACDRVLDANPKNADVRRRRAAYRGSVAASIGAFTGGPLAGLAPLADW